MKNIVTLKLYSRVARLGSFSAAARECGVAQSQVSRMIADLESVLGTRLLSRTTRAVVPTEAGLEFLTRIEPILTALEDAQNSVRESGELRGMLRVAMPTTMGMRVVLPRLARFTESHPALHVDVLLDDRWQDTVREAVDVGIHVGGVPDAAGTARQLGSMQRVVVAAPSYLAQYGTPESPLDLARHRIVGGPAAHANAWRFEHEGEPLHIVVQPQMLINDTAGAVAAAVGGLGITVSTSWACRSDLESGALVQLFPDWKTAKLAVNAYFPLGRATRMAARAFVDFIAAELASDPQCSIEP